MDYLHCNRCGYYPNRNAPGGEKRQLYLTSCGHIVCLPCTLAQADKSSCVICKSKCRSAEICASAKPEIKAFFLDPLEKVKESVQTAVWMLNFQRSQMKSFSFHASKSDAVRANLEEQNKLLKDENARLKQQVQFNQGVAPQWPQKGESPQLGAGFMVDTPGQNSSFLPIFPQTAKSDVSRSGSSTGLRLSQAHLGPGRLTLPYTPIRVDPQREVSPCYSLQGRPSSSSGSSYGYATPNGTPDITARLRQLQCSQSGRRPSPTVQFSQPRQYY